MFAEQLERIGQAGDFGLRHQHLHQLHRVEAIAGKERTLGPYGLAVEVAKIGGQVVRHEHRPGLEVPKVVDHGFNRRCVDQHLVGDAGVARDELGDATGNADEGLERADDSAIAHAFGADLENAMAAAAPAVGLDIEDHELGLVQALGPVAPRRQLPLTRRGAPQAVVLQQERLQSARRDGGGLGLHVQHRLCQMLQRQRAVGFGQLADSGFNECAAARPRSSVYRGHAAPARRVIPHGPRARPIRPR